MTVESHTVTKATLIFVLAEDVISVPKTCSCQTATTHYSVMYILSHHLQIQGGSNMTGTDFFFVTIIAHHSSNSQTGLNRF